MFESPKGNENILSVRHLEDVNDVETFGLDGPLKPEQRERGLEIGRKIAKDAREGGKRHVLLVSSPKRRTTETSEFIQEGIREDGLKCTLLMNDDLHELNQGTFNLPDHPQMNEDGKPLYIELERAWEVFWEQSFSEKDTSQDNILYQFGDPVLEEDGKYKYPELSNFFY